MSSITVSFIWWLVRKALAGLYWDIDCLSYLISLGCKVQNFLVFLKADQSITGFQFYYKIYIFLWFVLLNIFLKHFRCFRQVKYFKCISLFFLFQITIWCFLYLCSLHLRYINLLFISFLHVIFYLYRYANCIIL